jgi:hypothetical protein
VRLANVLVTGTLFVAVAAEGAYIVKTHRQMDALAAQVQQLAADAEEEPATRESPRAPWVGQRPTGGGSGSPMGKLPPPRFNTPPTFTTPSAPLPAGAPTLPAAIDTPEAREQLRQFVAAELQHQRDDWRQQQQQQREEDQRRRLEGAIKTLGLSDADGKKLTDIVTQAQDQRRDLRDKIQSGQLPREQIPQAMSALRDQTDKQIRALIGDDKAQQFQQLQRQGQGNRGGPGGFGGPFGGPPGGWAGGQPQAQRQPQP